MANRDIRAKRTKAATTSKASGAREAPKKKPAAARDSRSGGGVDAPGKKHRKAMPADPDATVADSQAAKMRAARPMNKTKRFDRRG